MQFKKIMAIAGSAIMSTMAFSAPVLATSVTKLNDVYDMVNVHDSTVDFPLFVYGANAKTSDMISATEAAGKFLTFAKTTTEVPIAGGTEAVTGGVKFEQPGNSLVTGESITNILTSIGGKELGVLDSGTFTTEKTGTSYAYNQYIDFGTDIAVDFHNEDDTDVTPAFMMRVDDGDNFYNYTLEFPEAVAYDLTEADDNLQGASIDWLGNTWTILHATESAGVVTVLEMISGKAVQTVILNTPATFDADDKAYTVELIAVNQKEEKATLNIDGVTYLVSAGVTKKLSDGTSVTVTDIFASSKESTPDSCKVFVGAKKVVLKDNSELEADDETIDGTDVQINSESKELSGWSVQVDAENDIFLKAGEESNDVIADAFNFKYTGYAPVSSSESDWTAIDFMPDGNTKTKLTFTNKDGETTNVPLTYKDGSNMAWGKDASYWLNLDESDYMEKNAYFFVSDDAGQYTHLLQVTDIDYTNKEVKFKNVGTGSTFTITTASGSPGVGTIRLNNKEYEIEVYSGSPDYIYVDMTGHDADYSDTFMEGDNGYIYTTFGAYSANMQFNNTGNYSVVIEEADYENGVNYYMRVPFGFDSDMHTAIKEPTTDNPYGFSLDGALLPKTDDISVGSTGYGTQVAYDSNSNNVKMDYPGFQLYHNLYIGSDITVSGTSGDTMTQVTMLHPTGYAKLDSEVTATDKANKEMVIWGGPCINSLVAELAASGKFDYTCDTWPAQNFGYLKLVNDAYATGKTVLIAAGTRAEDTTLAGNVLADGSKLPAASSAKLTGTAVSNVVVA